MDYGMFHIERYLGSEDETSNDSNESLEDIHNKNYNEGKVKEFNHKTSNEKEIDIKEYQDKSCNEEEINNNKDHDKDCNEDGINYKSKQKKHTNFIETTDLETSKQPLNDSVSCARDLSINDPNISSSGKKKNKDANKNTLPESTTLEAENKSEDIDINFQTEIRNDEGNFCTIGQGQDTIEKVKPILPKWLINPLIIANHLQEHEIPVSEISYLDSISKKNLQNYGIDFFFPVQSAVIPWLLQNSQHCQLSRPSDICVSAPTGSGKTLAFVLPIVQSLRSRLVTAVRALVVLPVSELAFQVYKVFEMFVKNTDLKVICLTGKKSFVAEKEALVKSGVRRTLSLVDIIITTPGRILDHINRTEGFCLQHLKYLVVDEADRLMDDIQKGLLRQIENAVCKNSNSHNCLCFAVEGKRVPFVPLTACHFGYINQPLQKLFYSATLSHDPEKLHTLSLYKPKLFTTTSKSEEWIGNCSIPENLSLYYIVCKGETKPLVLCHFIKENLFKRVLCFMESVEQSHRLHCILVEMGILKVKEISSVYTPIQRKIIIEQFSTGKIELLICSDIVARGIDFKEVDCVISYDVPFYIKRYVHRIGRSARAGKKGVALTLLTTNQKKPFVKLMKEAGMPVPEQVDVDDEELEMYVDSFKNALSIADSKTREKKKSRRLPEKKIRKRQKISE